MSSTVRRLLVLGACALLFAVAPSAATAAPNSEHRFAIEPGSFHVIASSYQAGGHADLTATFSFDHVPYEESEDEETYGDVKSVVVNLPAGFIGSNTAVPTCSDAQLLSVARCPPETQVGTITVDLAPQSTATSELPIRYTSPVYNMQSDTGVAATLGVSIGNILTQILPVSVRPSELGITVTTPSIEETSEPKDISFTVWGVPASPVHDEQRGEETFITEPGHVLHTNFPGDVAVHIPVKPFLSNPTSCPGTPLTATMTADSWEEPESWSEASAEIPPIVECDRNPFDPSFEALPTTTSAESPSGLNATLTVPQTYEDPESLASSELEDTRVALPEGMTINPSAGSGLGSCTPEQYARETATSLPGEGCPPEAKIGSVEIETPLLNEKLTGAVYVATPYDNPFSEEGHPNGSLLALYVVARDAERGVIVKVAGKMEPNTTTGQLVARFENTPQAPFSRFVLKFRPGATAPLVSPPACGAYSAQAELTPWSAPLEPQLVSSPAFQITQGVREGPCPSGGVPPFGPQVVAGNENGAAGSYSPFYLKLTRQDGEQEITGFSTVLPPGLTGNLTGVEKCPEADVEAARAQSGAEAEEHPACPLASEAGHTIVSAGVGTVLAQTPGRIYLAGAYHGDPLSLVSVTSAKVGPFDLGTVVIRFGLKLNPTTAQVEVDAAASEPIPHIIKGIVVHVREIHVYMSRANFTLNPTSCEPMRIANTITGGGANPANPADWASVTATSPFQMADCANLAFTPTFTVSTNGKTSKSGGASLSVKLSFPSGSVGKQANIREVKVDLPKQLPSRLTTLQKACTEKAFEANPASCPGESIVGHAIAHTPILPVPLEGPAYFVSHGGAKFPELIIVLQGYGLTIDLHGETFISKAGITSSTFHQVPDEPVNTFELTLPQGKYSALAANGNLCALTKTVTVKKKVTIRVKGHKKTVTRKVKKTEPAALTMPTLFVGQNGDTIHQSTPVTVTGCPKAHKATKHKRKAKNRRK